MYSRYIESEFVKQKFKMLASNVYLA